MPKVDLIIAAQAKGLAQANAQLTKMTKTLQGLTRASGMSGKGPITGAAATSFMGKLGFSPKQMQQLTAFQKDYDKALRTGLPGLVNTVNFQKQHADALRLVGMRTEKLGKTMRTTGRQTYYAGMMVSRMGYVLVGLAAALTGIGIASVKAFATFEANLADIRGLAGLTVDDIDGLGESMRQMSKDTVFSATEITKAGVALARTGIIARQGMEGYNKVMESSIILAGAFWRQGVTLEKTVESVTRTLNQFGFSADSAGRVINALAGASAFTLTNIQDLQKGLSYAGAAAASLGKDIEETVAVLGLLANMGIVGGRAGRMYRNILVRLSKAIKSPTARQQELAEATRQTGIAFKDLDIKGRSITEVMQLLKKTNLDLADSTDLVRQRAVVAFMILMRESGQLEELTQRIKNGQKAFEMYGIQMGTLAAKWKIFTNNVQALGITLGAILAPELANILGLFTNMIQKIDDLSVVQKRVLLIAGAFTTLGLAIMGITLIMAGFFIAAQFGFKFLIATLAPVLLTTGAILVIFGSLVVIAMLFKRTLEVMKGSIDDTFMKPFRDALDTTVEAIKTIVDNIVRFIQTLLQLPAIIKSTLKKIKLGDDKTIGENFVDAVKEEFGKTEGMKKLWEQITYGFNEGVKKPIIESGTIVAEELKETFSALGDYLKTQFPDAVGYIDKALARAEAGIKDLSAMLTVLGDKTNEEMTRVNKLMTDMAGNTDAIIKKVSASWADTIVDLLKGATTFADVWQRVLDDALNNFIHGFIRGILEGWSQALGNMVAGFIRAQFYMAAIEQMVGGVTSWFTGMTNTAATSTATNAVSTQAFQRANPGLFVGAEGGIVRKPTMSLIGESGPEAVVPLDEYNRNQGGGLTIINVVDPNFVNAQIAHEPDTVINLINADLIRGGSTRKTIKRIK